VHAQQYSDDRGNGALLVMALAHVKLLIILILALSGSASGLISPTNKAYVRPSVLRFLRAQAST
jgi:hypothetical protein